MSGDWLRRCVRRGNDEEGSMLIALLAVIVTSGLMITITATTVRGQQSVRFDRDHVRVVQAADAGVEDALFKLTRPVAPLVPNPALTPAASSGPTPVQMGDGSSYRWEIVPSPVEAGAWQINSTARLNGRTRSVSAVVAQPKHFLLAAFADSHMVLRGGNTADSYNASGWGTGAGTGEGDLGSNGTITLNGAGVIADKTQMHNWDAAPEHARCTSNGNVLCDTKETFGPKTDVTSAEALGFIDDAVANPSPAPGACGTTTVAFTGTSLAARPEPYCFSTMNLTANFTVTGVGKAVVYLTNTTADTTFGVSNKLFVNCTGCNGKIGAVPDASRLQIFTKAVGPIRIGNHSHVAASIFAPNATCGGNYSNAAANFYGSMVCRIITNQGAWSFHYDDRLRNQGSGAWSVKRWSEG